MEYSICTQTGKVVSNAELDAGYEPNQDIVDLARSDFRMLKILEKVIKNTPSLKGILTAEEQQIISDRSSKRANLNA